MVSSNDLSTVYDFVKATGEGNIRKIMVSPKMTTVHVGLLLKVVRSSTADDFVKHCEANSFPRLKFTDQEALLKDTFWQTACDAFVAMGLATHQKNAA